MSAAGDSGKENVAGVNKIQTFPFNWVPPKFLCVHVIFPKTFQPNQYGKDCREDKSLSDLFPPPPFLSLPPSVTPQAKPNVS